MKTEVAGACLHLPAVRLGAGRQGPALVVFLSQGTIGGALLEHAGALAAARPDLDVTLPPAPERARTDYASPTGVRMSAGNTLALLTAATYQVGVSTTALFEGMVLGCRTAVAELPGHEYLVPYRCPR